ncbi:MAG: enoyl-CoA hydratase/isomerase family protein [Actinomycetota bacterium]|nr:enoyl-CoA hydratase/isomerase family protein [Actinomycetota bacterium]MDK1102460.1 enoyl-CoA hydratase/isomerase family protein [Actinomycetota bacterium]MDK1290821.1 enoyl-CoA hydratase/isomerase family protein [Actinomycetota bacterium]
MELVEYSVQEGVAVITLNRPPVNALNSQLIADIDEAVGFAEDSEVRAVVITGAPHFAAGADITGFQKTFDAGGTERQASGLADAIARLANLEKPVIAAINGFALGGGLEIAMGADFRYLAESAKVGQPEILLGIIPGAGGTQRLSRLVGPQRCKELCFTGRHVKADEALAIGIADKVVKDEELLELAMKDAAAFAAGPTQAYAAVKRAVSRGFDRPVEEGLAIEAEQFARAFASQDARIGVAAFLAKEKPEFTGA